MDGNVSAFDTQSAQGCKAPAFPADGRGGTRRVIDWLLRVQSRARSRRMLALLDERMLRDIGLDRGQAAYEIDKPFWRE